MQIKNEGRVGKGWLNPARFVILALCVMLFVIFFIFLKIYLQNVWWYNQRW